ncbi:SC5A7 protein, partial [Polypterus senegalus]
MMKVILGIESYQSIIISAAVAICYTLLGGLYSVAYTDIIQLIFIIISLLSSMVDGCLQVECLQVTSVRLLALTGLAMRIVSVPISLATIVKVAPCCLTLQKIRGCKLLDPGFSTLSRIIGLGSLILVVR